MKPLDRLLMFLVAMLMSIGFTGPAHGDAMADKPHVLVILADDIGYSDIGIMGSEIRTPNLDKLAENGRIFTQFYNAARCCPTRASLMTGRYPHDAGIGHLIFTTPHEGYSDRLRSDSQTIAEILTENGYRTYMSGKWHLAPRSYDPVKDIQHWPTRRGFEKFYGTIPGSGSFWDPYKLCRNESLISPFNDPEYQPEHYYYTDAITDNALQFLSDHFDESPEKPFFLYMAYTAAHWPLHAPEESIAPYRGLFDEGYEVIHARRVEAMRRKGLLGSVDAIAPPVGDWNGVEDQRAEASLMETYAAMITHMDLGIGKVLDWLRQKGQSDNLFVLYLQDNGACAEDWFSDDLIAKGKLQPLADEALQKRSSPPMQTRDGRPVRTGESVIAGPEDTYTAYKESWANVSNAPFRWYKHFVHEGGISTPAILYYPPRIQRLDRFTDTLIDAPVHLIDVLPTILEISLKESSRQVQDMENRPGVSIWPLVEESETWTRPNPLFFEHESNRAVRDGKWKIVALENQPWELYDMSSDRAEMNNLAARYPDRVNQLAAKWDEWAVSTRVLPLGGWRDQNRYQVQRAQSASVILRQGDIIQEASTPSASGGGIRIETSVIGGPVAGTIAAQGDRGSGWILLAENDRIVFVVRRNRDYYRLESTPIPAPPFRLIAQLGFDGVPMLQVGNEIVNSGYWGPLISEPPGDLTAGVEKAEIARGQPVPGFAGILGPVQIMSLPGGF